MRDGGTGLKVAGTAVGVGLIAIVAWWGLGPSDDRRWSTIERAIETEHWEEAVAGLSRWVERHPDDSRAWIRLGTGLRMIGRLEEAEEALGKVSEGDPEWMASQFFLGDLAMERADREGAEQAYRAVIARQPAAIEPRTRLVSLLFLLRRTEEARAILWDLLALTGDPRHLVTLTGLALERDQSEQFRDLGGEGDRLLGQLGPFLERSPDDPWLIRARGLIRFEQGDPAGALADLETAARVMDDPAVRLALAESRLTLGEPGRVTEALGSPPESSADRARWWLLTGRAAAELGQDSEAIDAFREAVAADSGYLAAHYRLGRALARSGREEEAGPILDRAEAIRGRTDALKFAINERLSEGVDAGSCLEMGRRCLDSGMRAEARSWFAQASRLDPFLREAQEALATIGEAEPAPMSFPTLRDRVASAPEVEEMSEAAAISMAGPRFADEASERGLVFSYDSGEQGDAFIVDTMGGGVGLIDFDDDGWLDVYFVNGCPLPVDRGNPPSPNQLFRNNGDGTFRDVTESAGVGGRGYGMGCAVGDFDGDGFDDLFVTGFGSTVLYRNNGDGTFSDVTEQSGVFCDRWSTAAGFADLDGDGDLDLVVVCYVEADPETAPECKDSVGRPIHCPPGRFPSQYDLIFRNDGDGTFSDVSAEAGVEVPDGRGLGLAIADFDGDGRLDLFVANDAVPDFLFLNRGDLRFEEVGVASGAAFDGAGRATASMGVVATDLDGDGLIDLLHTNFRNEPNTLLRNLGGGLFADATTGSGLDGPSLPVTGFGAEAVDADNNGHLDLFIANGHVDDQPWIDQPMAQPPQAFYGRGDGRFSLSSPEAIGPYFARSVVGRGLAAGDLDNDGRVDLVAVHRDSPASLLRNVTPDSGHWLGVLLIGSDSGPTPIGARVSCRLGDREISRWRTSGTSYLSSSDPRLWFGLGLAETIDALEVRWPSGEVHRFEDVGADQLVRIREADGTIHGAGSPADR